jgi:anti-anti-sigma factor
MLLLVETLRNAYILCAAPEQPALMIGPQLLGSRSAVGGPEFIWIRTGPHIDPLTRCAMREESVAAGYLDIEITRSSGVVRIRLQGELDMMTAPLLTAALAGVRTRGRRHLVVDMTELHFMDRAGLAALLEVAGHGTRRAVLSVTGCPPNVRRVLELTGHEDLIMDSPLTEMSREAQPR